MTEPKPNGRRLTAEKILKIQNMLLDGTPYRKVAAECRVSPSTVEKLKVDLNRGGHSAFDAKKSAFMQAVEDFGTATMKMLRAQAEMLTDPNYTKNQPTESVIAHTAFVRDSFERIVRLQSAVTARVDALPSGHTEIIRAEVVDAA